MRTFSMPRRRLLVAGAPAAPAAGGAVGLHAELSRDYEAAWEEWDSSGERAAWESTVGDGLTLTG